MTVKDRLSQYIEYAGISNRKFSLTIGMSANYVTNIRKSLQPEVIDSIVVNYPELNIGWLLTGKGAMLNEEATQTQTPHINHSSISMGKVIPFYDAEAAAGGDYAVSMDPVSTPIGTIEIGGFLKDSESALRVYGNSMTPNYPAGCIVGLKPHYDKFIEPGNVYVVETADNRYLKRLYYNEDKSGFQCISDNHMLHEAGPRTGKPYYPDFEIPYSDVRRLFRVVGVIKRNIL